MKKRYLFTIGLLYFFISSYSQPPLLDSLFQALRDAKEDSLRADIFYGIAKLYHDKKELDSASVYIDKAIRLAEVQDLDFRKTKAIYLKGMILKFQGKDSLSLAYLLNAKAWYEKEKIRYDKFYMHLNLGHLYDFLGKIPEAAIQFDSAEIFLAKDNAQQAFDFNVNLGSFLWYQKKYEDARKIFLKNIQLSRQLKDSIQLYYAYADLGSLYNDLQMPDSGIYYLEKTIPVLQQSDPDFAASLEGCLGTNYKDLGDCEQALIHFKKGIANIQTKDGAFESCSFAEMASCYLILGDIEKANYYNDLAIGLLDRAEEFCLKRQTFEELISHYKSQGQYERALLNLESLRTLEGELFKAENNAAIEELKVKYQTREQQSEMELQSLKINRQRTIIILIIAMLALVSTILFLGWRNVLHRKRNNKLLAERNKHLEDLDQKKSRFFSNISHELRTPLTLVTAPLEEAFDKVKDKKVKNNIQLAHHNSQKLLVLVDEILDLSKLESGQMQLHYSLFHLEEVLRRIFFAFQSLAETRSLKLEFNSSLPKDIYVKADLPKLEKILNNLLSNGIKYNESGGKVILDVAQESASHNVEKFIIRISDSGKGIHPEDLPKIFDRFYQGDSGSLIGGTGIGLALTKELVHLFGGSIEVNSQVGKGSTFSLKLPLQWIDKPSLNVESMDESRTIKNVKDEIFVEKVVENRYSSILIDGQKPKILIVEDNPEMSRFLHQALSVHYECDLAYDGKKALALLESAHFDLVTSDVMMPEMDGFEFLEKVRQEGTVFKNVPFILLTARSLEKDKLDGFQMGVDDYITKPFSVKELVARINNLLKNKVLREEWEKGESVDRKVLKMAEQIILDHFSESNFGVHQLSRLLAVSQRSLERLIKRLTGMSPVGFIREIRLQKAYQFLKRRQFFTVTEVRHAVGIENASYFNRKFKERFGIKPKELLQPALKGELS